MKTECEYLFCFKPAVARVTVPHLKARQCNCEAHLSETLAWADRYRRVPGAVQVEQLAKEQALKDVVADVQIKEIMQLTDHVAIAVAAERERCAKIADERAAEDRKRWEGEWDWRQPYAFNRVIRASMDIAAAIRNPKSE